jgi:nitroreductase
LSQDSEIYPFILSRHSIRSYDQRLLSSADQAHIKIILNNTKSLLPENKFETILRSKTKREDLVEILGAYGRFITPPYYLVPYITGSNNALVDLGYHAEQIAVRLWSKGIGTCFIGCLSRQEKVRQLFQLPANAQIAAFLVFGHPGVGFGFETITKITKSIIGIRGRKSVEELFYRDTFDYLAKPEGLWEKIIEAGRMAPSAINAQPWRFLLRNEELYLFTLRNNRNYILPENQDYCFHDSGLCMANIDLALSSFGLQSEWQFLKGILDFNSHYPENYYPLAKLNIKNDGEKTIDFNKDKN